MYGRPDGNQNQQQPQQWTVHAEFTISHNGLTEQAIAPPTTHTEQDENGAVRMVYRWTSVSAHPTDEPCNTESETSHANPGNFLFTSVPPVKDPTSSTKPPPSGAKTVPNKYQDSSGYSSELLSPNSSTNNGQRVIQPYNRRCRSTCSIVLSTNLANDGGGTNVAGTNSQCCGRTQSLRCQTPMARCDVHGTASGKDSASGSFYGCGDPWCYHSNYDDTASRFSPLLEADEYTTAPTASIASTKHASTSKSRSRTCSNTNPSFINQRSSKDASVQTYEMVDKCTSPYLRSYDSMYNSEDGSVVTGKLSLGGKFGQVDRERKNFSPDSIERKKRTPPMYLTRRKTEPIRRNVDSPKRGGVMSPDSLDSKQYVKRAIRPPQQSSTNPPSTNLLEKLVTSGSGSTNTDKKPRTVHIDVYCTGTEQESDSSSSSTNSNDEEKTVSSPQTVFESTDVKITHIRADPKILPNRIQTDLTSKLLDDKDGDSDVESTSYPSQLSSYSAIRDFDSSFSTVPWSRMSLSSCDTSWKDTGSDLASLLDGSRDLGSRKLACESITEMPETDRNGSSRDALKTPSSFDSFEYAASEDRHRIKHLNEEIWKQKQWKSPQLERKHLLQSQKIDKYMTDKLKSLPTCQKESESDSSDTDQSEKGWSFVKTSLDREDTIKRSLKPQTVKMASPCKSPSILIVKQKLTENPELTAPFTAAPGIFTEQRQIARRFGRIIDVYKKPGHHIGPAKNPDCLCNHCAEYFSVGLGRGRTRSISGVGGSDYYSWKRGNDLGRGSEPPQSREEMRLQLEREEGYGLARNASMSNM